MTLLLQTKMTRLEAVSIVAALAGLARTGLSRSPARAQDPLAVSEPVWETLGIATDLWLAPGITME